MTSRRGFLLGLAVIAARILLDLAYMSLATLGAFVGLYAVGAFLYLRRRSVFRPESASEGPTVAPWLAAALLLGMALRGSVIVASPNPVIDVYAMMRDGTDHLLAGRNPYTEEIDTPYDVPESLATEGFEPPDPRPAGYPPHPRHNVV